MTLRKQSRSRLKPHRNPYREAQAKQRKAANLARQKVLQEQRSKATGHPVRSASTPFIQSLATGQMPGTPTQAELRNFFLGPEELSQSLEYSNKLAAPYIPKAPEAVESATAARSPTRNTVPPNRAAPFREQTPSASPPILPIERGDTSLPPEESSSSPDPYADDGSTVPKAHTLMVRHEAAHKQAARALSVISSLSNGSSSDLTRYNIQRCISTFGRHSTDAQLPPRPTSIYNTNPSPPKLRAGPDTGSSEVQVAILTAKIHVLANNLYNKDKHNKRNLRLMVHKRQKLLAYLHRRERGGPRWKNLVETLGIQDAMWKGEISL
jgi:ribosomal protein S15